jgi:hypothetical protein
MPTVSRKVLISAHNGRCVWPGFTTYISQSHPIMMDCHGWVDASDTYDDFATSISDDNGKTWSEPVMQWKSTNQNGGRLRYSESAAIYEPSANRLLVVIDRGFYPDGGDVNEVRWSLVFQEYDPAAGRWSEQKVNNFGLREGLFVSFSAPIRTASGTILVPAQKAVVDENGKDVHLDGYWSALYESLVIIGTRKQGGAMDWKLSGRVNVDPQKSSRGVCEPTVAELKDGRIAMICRGDNGYYPDRPGCKWVSFSNDTAQTWSQPQPLMLTNGKLIESSASGSALIRSIANGKLYYLANLCIAGERPNGSWPRSPLVLAEVSESPFALKSETLCVIDERHPDDSEKLQLSNFRYHQDRQSGELCIRLSRLGERSAKQWKDADFYEYRVKL